MNRRRIVLTLVFALSIILSQSDSNLITSSSGQIAEKTDPITTTEDSATLKLKIKGGATPGSYQITVTGRDESGRARTANVTLIVL